MSPPTLQTEKQKRPSVGFEPRPIPTETDRKSTPSPLDGAHQLQQQFGNAATVRSAPAAAAAIPGTGAGSLQSSLGNAAVRREVVREGSSPDGYSPNPGVLRRMEESFGENLSTVAVRPAGESAPLSDAVAEPDQIGLNRSVSEAGHQESTELLGHELAHVVQKRRGTIAPDDVDFLSEGREPPSTDVEAAATEESATTEPESENETDVENAETSAAIEDRSEADDVSQESGEDVKPAEAEIEAPTAPPADTTTSEDEGGAASKTVSAPQETSLAEFVSIFERQAPALEARASEAAAKPAREPGAQTESADRAEPEQTETATTLAQPSPADEARPGNGRPAATETGDRSRREQLEREAEVAGGRAARGESAPVRSGTRVPRRQFGFFGWVGRNVRGAASWAWGKAGDAASAVGDAASWAWGKVNSAREAIGRARNWVKDKVAEKWGWFTNKLSQGWNWAEGKFDGALDWLRENGGWVGRAAAWGLDFYRDFVKGFWKGAYNCVAGLLKLGYHAGQLVNPFEWIFNPETNVQRLDTLAGVFGLLTTPEGWSTLWSAFKDPFVKAWRPGNYGEAIGMGVFEVVNLIFGTKGFGKAGRAGSAAAKAGGIGGRAANLSRIFGKLTGGLSRLRGGLSRAIGNLRGSVSGLVRGLASSARRYLTRMTGRLSAGITSLLQRGQRLLTSAFGGLRERLRRFTQQAQRTVSQFLTTNPLTRILQSTMGFIRRLPSLLQTLANRISTVVQGLVRRASQWISKHIARRIRALMDRGRTLRDRAQTALGKAIQRGRNRVTSLWQRAQRRLGSAWNTMSSGIQKAWSWVGNGFNRLWGGLTRKFREARTRIREWYDRVVGKERTPGGGPTSTSAPGRTFASQGSGTHLIRNTTASGKPVQIKSGHGYNRPHTGPGGVVKDLRNSGLTMDQIENAILNDLESLLASGTTLPKVGARVTRPLKRTVTVGGQRIGYRAVETPGGTISIGTYFWK